MASADTQPTPERPPRLPGEGWMFVGPVGCLVFFWVFIPSVLPVVLLLLAFGLPLFLCQRWRVVRWLPVIGPPYFAVFVLVASVVLGDRGMVPAIVFGTLGLWICFPPDPLTFFFRPHLRRAVFRALEYAEREMEIPVNLTEVGIERSEPGRTIVRIGMESRHIGIAAQRIGVSDDGTIEPLLEDDEFDVVETPRREEPPFA